MWAVLIFCASSIPSLKTELPYDFILRKIAHVLEYFIFTFLLHRAFKASWKLKAFYLFAWPASVSLLYAISDEFHQMFVAGRSGSLQDVLVDAAGILGFYVFIKAARLI